MTDSSPLSPVDQHHIAFAFAGRDGANTIPPSLRIRSRRHPDNNVAARIFNRITTSRDIIPTTPRLRGPFIGTFNTTTFTSSVADIASAGSSQGIDRSATVRAGSTDSNSPHHHQPGRQDTTKRMLTFATSAFLEQRIETDDGRH